MHAYINTESEARSASHETEQYFNSQALCASHQPVPVSHLIHTQQNEIKIKQKKNSE